MEHLVNADPTTVNQLWEICRGHFKFRAALINPSDIVIGIDDRGDVSLILGPRVMIASSFDEAVSRTTINIEMIPDPRENLDVGEDPQLMIIHLRREALGQVFPPEEDSRLLAALCLLVERHCFEPNFAASVAVADTTIWQRYPLT